MRYLVLVSAVVMQICLGATYSWSVYVHPLKELTGLHQGPVQAPYTAFYFIFPLTTMLVGGYLPRIGARRSAMLGGVLFGGGWILAGLGKFSFLFTVLGVGCLSGIGAGMAYIVPITVCIRWFPNNMGLVSGVAVAGFGGGAALVSQIGGWLLRTTNMSPFDVFMAFGGAFLVLVVAAGAAMVFPREEQHHDQSSMLKFSTVYKHRSFQILYFAMFTGLAAGMALNANLKELYQGEGDAVQFGIVAVSLFAVANALGRITWGAFFDRINSATAIQINMVGQAAVFFCAPFLLYTKPGFWAVAFLAGFNYGGVLVIYVSSASRVWGSKKVGQVYSWIFSSNVLASFAPIVAGIVYDTFHNFNPALYAIATLMLVCCVLVRRNPSLVDGPQSMNSEKTTS